MAGDFGYDLKTLSNDHKSFLIFAINQWGNGQHPVMSTANIGFANSRYACDCAKAALASGELSADGQKVGEEVVAVLEGK